MLKHLPLVTALLGLTVVGLGRYAFDLHKQLGAQAAECRELRLKDVAERNEATTSLIEESLRHQITALEADLARLRDAAEDLARRNAANQKLLNEYRKKVDANEDSSTPLTDAERERLRDLEHSYRIRSERSGQTRIRGHPSDAADPALRDFATQRLSDSGGSGQSTRRFVGVRPGPQRGQAEDPGTVSALSGAA